MSIAKKTHDRIVELEHALRDAAHLLTVAAGEIGGSMPNTAALLSRSADRALDLLEPAAPVDPRAEIDAWLRLAVETPQQTAFGRPPYASKP